MNLRMRILIAEDDPVSRRLVCSMLKPYGECTEAAEGSTALSEYLGALDAGRPFQLVILDLLMPGLDGIAVLEAIRGNERAKNLGAVPVIMLTAQADVPLINKAVSLGVRDYMLKPIDRERLIRELQRLKLVDDPMDTWE